jgi:diacylglycerol O-acyltransferase
VAIMSYNGGMDFGLLADFDAMPDLDALGAMFEEARDELVAQARAASPEGEAGHGRPDGARRSQNGRPDAGRGTNTPKRTSRPRTSSRASKGA